ncbi:helix-turn-helix domain-containing protein [Listeria booriae]|uniref:helix-turn-helix domain-containing protein n=1 Tax=Listeria booriae TaxID=1552123 RepID=UPI00162A9C32|nr:helix-turn-helix domain-containing protein [Listeria booriae]MBC2104001.1 helix-turn-helix domain-containing protein [Listeria booriae]
MATRQGFTKVNNSAIDDKTLKASEKALYTALSRYADNKTRQCYPSKETLLSTAGISDHTFRLAIKTLEKRNYIRIEPRSNGLGRQLSNLYTLLK